MAGDSRSLTCDWLPRWGPQEELQSHRRGLECNDTSSREGRAEKMAPERRPSWLLWRRSVRRDGRDLRGGRGRKKTGGDASEILKSRERDDGQTPEGLWVDVGQLWVVAEL